ncbi:MAG: glycosyl hydrolase [Parcubacteria group bacterium LiPW_41]|nr:MAG: glycosyl hydrolase [Parcubacteria group bacterium LiPW_41]
MEPLREGAHKIDAYKTPSLEGVWLRVVLKQYTLKNVRRFGVLISFILVFFPLYTFGAQKFSYGVWIPYWKRTAAVPEVSKNISKIKTISPFSYEVQKNGKIWDAMKLKEEGWLQLLELTGSEGKTIVPTITWMKGDEIHSTLSSSTLRLAHIKNIVTLVDQNDFDGVDIDYENKLAETKVYFTKFITELKKELAKRKKILSCTLEARTPLASRFSIVPKNLEYANDFKELGKVCDEVRIMAYGQGNIDILLNKAKRNNGKYYMPVADKDWVEKVIKEALKSIKKEKIVLGVANFGYEYSLSTSSSSSTAKYEKLRSVTYKDVSNILSLQNKKGERNSAGEFELVYTTSTIGNSTSSLRFISFSDAYAIQDKIKLAKKYNLKGVMVFRIDGESDPKLWEIMK